MSTTNKVRRITAVGCLGMAMTAQPAIAATRTEQSIDLYVTTPAKPFSGTTGASTSITLAYGYHGDAVPKGAERSSCRRSTTL